MFLTSQLLCGLIMLGTFVYSYRLLQSSEVNPEGPYFKPYDKGFVGKYGDPSNLQRERIKEGAYETPSQELLFESPSRNQVCPGMVGPFYDGSYYCSAKEFGYCDRRSGLCVCNIGYEGVDCSDCTPSHFRLGEGSACYPKTFCPNDCSGAGSCNYYNGSCECAPHRTGLACETLLCSIHSPLCESCTSSNCLRCAAGSYLTLDSRVCSSCLDFDPRCAGCTKDQGCTVCADPILRSIRRSGFRSSDPKELPIEEYDREFGLTLGFGSKSSNFFAEAENYFVTAASSEPLSNRTLSCSQGKHMDEAWTCDSFPSSYVVCGHLGVFRFTYPNYVVGEGIGYLRLTVERSGGGYGNVSVGYSLHHISTSDNDVVATAPYTTVQTLTFEHGVVRKSFLVAIIDDVTPETDEIFQVVLLQPEGGGSLSAQFRTNITIRDNDANITSGEYSVPLIDTVKAIAGQRFEVTYQSRYKVFNVASGRTVGIANVSSGGDFFISSVKASPKTSQRMFCPVLDLGNGRQNISCVLHHQGSYELRTWLALPGGLLGNYYRDPFFQTLAVSRIDSTLNFTWGFGRIMPRGKDYATVRWEGALRVDVSAVYEIQVFANDYVRLWIADELSLNYTSGYSETKSSPSAYVWLNSEQLTHILLDYRKLDGFAYISLQWRLIKPTNSSYLSSTSPVLVSNSTFSVIPKSSLFSLHELPAVNVIVSSTETNANATRCEGLGLRESTVGEVATFSLCPKDRFGNLRDDIDEDFLATEGFNAEFVLTDDQGYDGLGSLYYRTAPIVIRPILVYNYTTNCYDASYMAEVAGLYNLNVTFSNGAQTVCGTNLTMRVSASPRTNAALSEVFGLQRDIAKYILAGSCFNFTIRSRDIKGNLRKHGGDNFTVYLYGVAYFEYPYANESNKIWDESLNVLKTKLDETGLVRADRSASILSRSTIVRFGEVDDLRNGNYSARICAITAGMFEVHVLLNGDGVSNQPYELLDPNSQSLPSSGTGKGSYVGESPFALIVKHEFPSSATSTVCGGALFDGTVGVTSTFWITFRDHWGNIMRSGVAPNENLLESFVGVKSQLSPQLNFSLFNLRNGSVLISFVPDIAGDDWLSVSVAGMQVESSPFRLRVVSGTTAGQYTIVRGITDGVAGVEQGFELQAFDGEGNPKRTNDDIFVFLTTGSNNISGTLQTCVLVKSAFCSNSQLGFYFGSFTPYRSGPMLLSIFLAEKSSMRRLQAIVMDEESYDLSEIQFSPFHIYVKESSAYANRTVFAGDLSNFEAGKVGTVLVNLNDKWGNSLTVGGASIELALIGVAGRWGTEPPYANASGIPNEFYYQGFYAGIPAYYGSLIDFGNGSYILNYNAHVAGQYVLRMAILEPGLNLTIFNDTHWGHLWDGDTNDAAFILSTKGAPNSYGTAKSWTGDLGSRGGLIYGGINDTYIDRAFSRVENTLTISLNSLIESNTLSSQKLREEYWSARFVGVLTPPVAETFSFIIEMDGNSYATLYLGGRGVWTNNSDVGTIVAQGSGYAQGSYSFEDGKSRELRLDFRHGPNASALLRVMWQSTSTPISDIPSTAFNHYVNVTHANLTITPAALCSRCSTAFGKALSEATAGVQASFIVLARDKFGNLLQHGNDHLAMVAVGQDGTSFRGDVTDFGNSTYHMSYVPVISGQYRVYISLGCCVPDADVGLSVELATITPLLIHGSPFLLTVSPNVPSVRHFLAFGGGLKGCTAGDYGTFEIYYKDSFNNSSPNNNHWNFELSLRDVSSGTTIAIEYDYYDLKGLEGLSVQYRTLTAGHFWQHVQFDKQDIYGSPFLIFIAPSISFAALSLARGKGIQEAVVNLKSLFAVSIADKFGNIVPPPKDTSSFAPWVKLYSRLIGDQYPEQYTYPQCLPRHMRNDIICGYVSLTKGLHRLSVQVLNSTAGISGGQGLKGEYFASLDFGSLATTSIDRILDFRWNVNYFVRQSIRWTGYVVVPVSGEVKFKVVGSGYESWIYIEDQLVFHDPNKNSVNASTGVIEIPFATAFAYIPLAIRVEVVIDVSSLDHSISLWWALAPSEYSLRWNKIPGFFLYDSAQHIQFSPFLVNVHDDA